MKPWLCIDTSIIWAQDSVKNAINGHLLQSKLLHMKSTNVNFTKQMSRKCGVEARRSAIYHLTKKRGIKGGHFVL